MAASQLFPAALWHDLTCEWLWVYHGTAPRVREWSQEITVPPGVFFVESGTVKIRADGNEIDVLPGQAFFSAPGVRQQWFEKQTRLLSVGLRCHWPDGQPLFNAGLNLALPSRSIRALNEETQRLFTTIHGRRKQVTYAEGKGMQNRTLRDWAQHEAAFRLWFAEYLRTLDQQGIQPASRTKSGDRRLELLRQWLQEWPLDQSLNWNEIAGQIQLSPRRMQQLLREDLGMTAQVYLERRRLEYARQRLVQEDIPLKEIAFAVGFRHPPHFTTWFRRHTGMTPTAYRGGQGFEAA